MNLQEKVQVIENDVVTLKKGIERIKDRYPLSVYMLVRGNKTGLSLSIDRDFDNVPESVFIQKTASQF
jgi:hypothetical protein